MPFKMTFFFQAFRYSWSEAYYGTGSPASGGGQSAAQSDLINARGAVLGNNATLTGVRVSSFPANRVAQDLDVSSNTTTGNWTQNTPLFENPTNIPNVAVIFKCATPVGFKLIYVSGVPEGVVQADAVYPVNANPSTVVGWQAAANRLSTVLSSGQWGCRSWKGTTPVQATGAPVSGPQVPPLVGIPVATLQPWVVGQKVLLSGWRRVNPRSPGLSGLFTLFAVPPASQVAPPFIYYLYGTQNVVPTNFKTTGQIGLVNYVIEPFANAVIVKATTRKRGVRTGGPLGRFSRVR